MEILQNKKTSLIFFIKQKKHFLLLIGSLIINILIIGWLSWRVDRQNEVVPLSFNIYFGIDYLGNWQKIFLGPLLGLIIILVNFYFAWLVFLKNKFLSFWLIDTALVAQILILIFYLYLIINYY